MHAATGEGLDDRNDRIMPQTDRSLPLEIISEVDVSPELDREIRQLLCECFPPDVELFSRERHWHHSVPAYSVLCHDVDRLVGHVAIVDRQITCDGQPVRVAGVQSLAVASLWRRTRLSQRLMIATMDEARRRGHDFGLLFCVPELERFYSALDWQKSSPPVRMLDEQGRAARLPAKNIVMHFPLADRPFPSGPIDLRGPDW
jgi:predicted N-acetyltransferase YhbS